MDAAVFREPRRRFIPIASRAGAGEMAVLEFGPADRPVDVVFVHANGFNGQTYRALLAPLSAGLRVLAVDQRGHGSSRLAANPERRRSWLDLRDDLLALLTALDQEPVVLAGHSMGATVSLLAAEAVPDAVRGLVLLDPVIMPRIMAFYAHMPWTSGALWKHLPLVQGRCAAGPCSTPARPPSPPIAGAGRSGPGPRPCWPTMSAAASGTVRTARSSWPAPRPGKLPTTAPRPTTLGGP